MSNAPASNDSKPDYVLAREELAAVVASLNLSVSIVGPTGLVEKSKDRTWPHLSYVVVVNGESFDYRMGIGHIPWNDLQEQPSCDWYRYRIPGTTRSVPISDTALCSVIRTYQRHPGAKFKDELAFAGAAARIAALCGVKPNVGEVLGAVARDGEASRVTFEDWCAEFGYDEDSRTAERVYDACCQGLRKLLRIVSRDTANKLAELAGRL